MWVRACAKERERERERKRETDRQTDRQTDRDKDEERKKRTRGTAITLLYPDMRRMRERE